MMSEQMKATLKLIVSALAAGVAAAMVAITSAGQDDLEVFKRPSVILATLGAILPVLLASLSKSPAQGAAMDRAIEKKADAKAEERIQTAVDNGEIHRLVAEASRNSRNL